MRAWGVTRTGYHGVRVDGQEPGRFEQAALVVSSWLQGTSRDGDPKITFTTRSPSSRTVSDGKWRSHDTASLRAVLGALQGIAAMAAECGLTAEFGVEWIPRADGRGNEIAGITQAQMDAYSTRTVQVHAKARELARARGASCWETSPRGSDRGALEKDPPSAGTSPAAYRCNRAEHRAPGARLSHARVVSRQSWTLPAEDGG